jgi:hypothetical protein
MYHIIVSREHPDMALSVDGQTLLFTTEDEAMSFRMLRFGIAAESEFDIATAPEDINGMVVA